jgi:hypothetical protein
MRTASACSGTTSKHTCGISVSLLVRRELFFGQLPVPRVSGFKDEFSGKIITNAFTIGLLDPDEVARSWLRIASDAEAPLDP